jgi:hypothetical protein
MFLRLANKLRGMKALSPQRPASGRRDSGASLAQAFAQTAISTAIAITATLEPLNGSAGAPAR